MFNKLFDLFQKSHALSHMSTICYKIESIIDLFEEEYMKDKNTKDAAIDALIEILQKHKSS